MVKYLMFASNAKYEIAYRKMGIVFSFSLMTAIRMENQVLGNVLNLPQTGLAKICLSLGQTKSRLRRLRVTSGLTFELLDKCLPLAKMVMPMVFQFRFAV